MREFTRTLGLALILTLSAPFPALGRQDGNVAAEHKVISGLRQAATLIGKRDLPGAEAELVHILEQNPREPRALNLMGVIRAEQGRSDEAEAFFRKALLALPSLAGARVNLGLLYMTKERVEDAAKEFEEALRIDGDRRDAASNLVVALRRLAAAALAAGDREKALSHLIRARSFAASDPDVLFEFGMAAMGLSLYEDAAGSLAAALGKRPNEPRFLYALARARLGTGEILEAERLFRRYVELRPQDATGHYGLGYALALLRRGAEAARSLERSLEIRPAQTESQYQLGLLAYAEGDLDAAAGWFDKALSRYADHAGALLGRGLIYFNRKEYELARRSFERVVTLDPALAKAHYHLGLTLARLGDKAAADREIEIADKLGREQKEKERIVLRLLDPEPRAGAQKQ